MGYFGAVSTTFRCGGDSFADDFFLAHAGPDTATAERLYGLLADETSFFLDSRSLVLGDDWDRHLPRHSGFRV